MDEKVLEKYFAEDIASLEGNYYKEFLKGLNYIKGQPLSAKIKKTLTRDLLEVLGEAQEKKSSINRSLGGNVYVFVDRGSEVLEKTSGGRLFLNIGYTISMAILVTFIFNGILSFFTMAGFPKLEPGMMALKVELFISTVVVLTVIDLVKARFLRSSLRSKLLYFILTIGLVLGLNYLAYGLLARLGFKDEFLQITRQSYFILTGISGLVTYLIAKLFNK